MSTMARCQTALAALTGAFEGDAEEIELENLLPDAVRLAVRTGDLETAKSLAEQADELAKGSEIPHRQANALYCEGLLDHDACPLAHRRRALSGRQPPAARGEGVRGRRRGVPPRR